MKHTKFLNKLHEFKKLTNRLSSINKNFKSIYVKLYVLNYLALLMFPFHVFVIAHSLLKDKSVMYMSFFLLKVEYISPFISASCNFSQIRIYLDI